MTSKTPLEWFGMLISPDSYLVSLDYLVSENLNIYNISRLVTRIELPEHEEDQRILLPRSNHT